MTDEHIALTGSPRQHLPGALQPVHDRPRPQSSTSAAQLDRVRRHPLHALSRAVLSRRRRQRARRRGLHDGPPHRAAPGRRHRLRRRRVLARHDHPDAARPRPRRDPPLRPQVRTRRRARATDAPPGWKKVQIFELDRSSPSSGAVTMRKKSCKKRYEAGGARAKLGSSFVPPGSRLRASRGDGAARGLASALSNPHRRARARPSRHRPSRSPSGSARPSASRSPRVPIRRLRGAPGPASVTKVGGASSMTPSSRRSMRSAGRIRPISRISPLSDRDLALAGPGHKNQVMKRRGA